MIKLLVWGLIIYVVIQMFKGRKGQPQSTATPHRPQGEETQRDPICGVYVGEENAVIGRYEGERLFFCSMDCLEKYRQQLTEK